MPIQGAAKTKDNSNNVKGKGEAGGAGGFLGSFAASLQKDWGLAGAKRDTRRDSGLKRGGTGEPGVLKEGRKPPPDQGRTSSLMPDSLFTSNTYKRKQTAFARPRPEEEEESEDSVNLKTLQTKAEVLEHTAKLKQ
jgi:hypothetical protein